MIGQGWRRLRPMLGSARPLLAALVATTALGSAAEAGALVLVGRAALATAVDDDAARSLPDLGPTTVAGSLVLAAVLAVLTLALHAVGARLTARAAADVLAAARRRAIDGFFGARWERQATERSGALQETTTSVADQVSLLAVSFVMVVAAAINLAAFVAVAAVVDPRATLVVLVAGAVLFGAVRPAAIVTQRRTRRFVDANSSFAEDVGAAAGLVMEQRALGVRREAAARLRARSEQVARIQEASRFWRRFGETLYRDLAVLVLVGAVAVLAQAPDLDEARIGLVVVLVVRTLASAQGLHAARHNLREHGAAFDALEERLASLEAAAEVWGSAPLDEVGPVVLDDVTYRYGDAAAPALDGVSLTLAPGEVVGVVGPSGSGKSTLAQVLLRLRRPQGGSVRVGGRPYEEIAEEAWARRVAFVPQEPRLLEGTVAENVTFLRSWIDRTAVERALVEAHLDAEVRALPAGLDTPLGPAATGLSVGQKQRMAIARALAGGPSLLVLDEPTSALDVTTEAGIRATVESLRGTTTTVMIAHRLSTLRTCDRVVVLRAGALVAVGTPDEVLGRDDLRPAVEASLSPDDDPGGGAAGR